MPDAPRVVIVTLNWNRPADTLAFLQTALAQQGLDCPIIVVDNGSSDDSIDQISAAYPEVEIIATGKNLGFAGGCNVGLRRARELDADYVFLVNNDTLLAPDCLSQLVAHTAPEVGLLAPVFFYADAPSRPWLLGGNLHPILYEITGDTATWFAKLQAQGSLDLDMVPFCGVLLSRAALAQVGEFDERFFMYYDDMDYSARLRRAGFTLRIIATAHLWHKVSSSSGGRDSPNERYWMARSSVLYFRKYVRGWRWLCVGPYRLMSALRQTVRLSQQRNWPALRSYWKGLGDGLFKV